MTGALRQQQQTFDLKLQGLAEQMNSKNTLNSKNIIPSEVRV